METLGRSYQAARICLSLSVWTQSFVLPFPTQLSPLAASVTCCLLAGPHISTPLNFVHGVLWPACPFPLLALKSLTHILRLCKYSTPTNASLIGLFPSSARRFVSALVLLPAVTMHLILGRVCVRARLQLSLFGLDGFYTTAYSHGFGGWRSKTRTSACSGSPFL